MANTSESKNTTARKERRKAWWKKQQEKGSSDPQGEGIRLRVRKPKVENDQPRQASVVETRDGFKLKLKLNNSMPVKVGKKTVTKQKKKPLQSKGTSTVVNSEAVSSPKKKSQKPKAPTPAETPPKPAPKTYVLFVGNLPFDITKEQLLDHFRKTGGAKSVRIPKERGTDKGRGFAYIEFRDGISFRVGLRLHQTTLAGRKINVEFTSIGGNNKNRREKLNAKNKALEKLKVPIGD